MSLKSSDVLFVIYTPSKNQFWDGVTWVSELGAARLYDLKEGAENVLAMKGRLDGSVILRVEARINRNDQRKLKRSRDVYQAMVEQKRKQALQDVA